MDEKKSGLRVKKFMHAGTVTPICQNHASSKLPGKKSLNERPAF